MCNTQKTPQALPGDGAQAKCPDCHKSLVYFDTVRADKMAGVYVRHYPCAQGNCSCSPNGFWLPTPETAHLWNVP